MSKSDTQNNEGQPGISESTNPEFQVTQHPAQQQQHQQRASSSLESSEKNAQGGGSILVKSPPKDQSQSSAVSRFLSGVIVVTLITCWLLFVYKTFADQRLTLNSNAEVNNSIIRDRSLRQYWKEAMLPKKWHRKARVNSGPEKVGRMDPDLDFSKPAHMATQVYHKHALLTEIMERLPNITKTLIVEDFRGTLFRLEWLLEDFMWATSVGIDAAAAPKLDLGTAESGSAYSYFTYPRNSSQQSMVSFVDSCLLLRQNDNFQHLSETEEDQDHSQRIFKSARLIASPGGRLIYTDCTGELVPLSLTVEDILSQSPLKSPLFPNLVLVGSQTRDIRTLQFATGETINSRCTEDPSNTNDTQKCANTCSLPWRKGLFLDNGVQLEIAESITQIFAVNTTTHQKIWGLKLNQIAPVAVAEVAAQPCVVGAGYTFHGNPPQRRSEVKVWDPVDTERTCDTSTLSKIIFDAITLEDNVLQIDICNIYEYIQNQSAEPSTGMSAYWLNLCADTSSRLRLQTRHVFPSPLLQVFSLKDMSHSSTTDLWRSGRFAKLPGGSTSLTLTPPLINQKIDVPFDFKDSLRNHLFSCVFEDPGSADGRNEPLHQRLPVYKSASVTVKRETIEKSLLPYKAHKAELDLETSRKLTLDRLRDLLSDPTIKDSSEAPLAGKLPPDWAKANDVKLLPGVLYALPDVSQEQNRDNLLFVLSPTRRSLKFQLVTLLVPSLCLVGLGWYAHGRLTSRPKNSSKRNGNAQIVSGKKDVSSLSSETIYSMRSMPSRIYRKGLRRKSKSNEVSANSLLSSPENHRSLKALKSTMAHLMFGTGEDTDDEDCDEDLPNGIRENSSIHADYKWWAARRRILNDMGRGMARNIRSVVFRKSSSDGALRKFASEASPLSPASPPPESQDRKTGKKSWFDVRKYVKGPTSVMQNDSTTATQREIPAIISREGGTNTSEHSSEESPIMTAKKIPVMAMLNPPSGAINNNNNQIYDSAGTLIESNVPPDSLLSELLENGRSTRTFDHWQLIGKGGFGSVYKVRHRLEPDQTCYALKLVEFQASTDGAIKYGRNFREVSTNRDVTSKYVVRYFTWWCEEPQFLPPSNAHTSTVEIARPVPPLCSRPVIKPDKTAVEDSNEIVDMVFQSRRALDESDDAVNQGGTWMSNPGKIISVRKADGFSKPLRAHLAALAEEFKGRLNGTEGETKSPRSEGLSLTRTKRKYSQSFREKSLNESKFKRTEDGSASSDDGLPRSSVDSPLTNMKDYFYRKGGTDYVKDNSNDYSATILSDSDDGISFAERSNNKSESPPKLELERTQRKRFTSEAPKQVIPAPVAQKNKNDDVPDPHGRDVERKQLVDVIRVRACKVTLVIQMEWCNGMTLRQWLEKPERHTSCLISLDSSEERLELVFFKQIMKGIRDIHKQGIVHRDLKPENIFVQHNSIKIGDFGLSKLVERHQQRGDKEDSESLGPGGGQTSLDAMVALQRNFSLTSLAGVMIGTPSYAAPEGGVNCSEKADIYSAALILLELLSHGMKTSHERQRLLSDFRNHSSFPDYFEDGNFESWKLLLECMSHVDPTKRPSAETILSLIKTCNYEVPSTKYQLDVAALRVKLKEHSLT